MLKTVKIRNFKSYKDATLSISPLTVLIGANASGKSNAIEALKMLSWLVQGSRLGSITYELQEQDHEIRGLVWDLGFRNSESFEFHCTGQESTWDKYTIKLGITNDGHLFVQDEKLSSRAESYPYFRVVSSTASEGVMELAYNSFSGRGRKPHTVCTNQLPAIVQLDNPAIIDKRYRVAQNKIPNAASECRNELRKISFMDPQPREMRWYVNKNQRKPYSSGSNISGILRGLCENPASKEMILDIVKSLPDQDIVDIDFIETSRGDVMVNLIESFGNTRSPCDATLLSDGTLRALAAAAAVLSAPKNGLVIIEEIDNGVHPSRASQLLEGLARVANGMEVNLLISSHNPALLNVLPTEAIPNVMISYRDGDAGASNLVRLGDVEDFSALVTRGRLGDLMARGDIERFIIDNPGPEANLKHALAWLDSIRQ